MCRDLTREGDEPYGTLLRVCGDFARHLLGDYVSVDEVRDSELSEAVLCAFGEGVTEVVVEKDYFDLDYRSEFSATHETTFAARNPSTARIHVFAGRGIPGSEPCGLYDYVDQHVSSYLGYVVVRPQQPGSVGRSMIAPRRVLDSMKDPSTFHARVRTAVTEIVTLFGIQLSATAVPFIEQDEQLLRCVHAAAWMCHYSAVLRGLVPRRPTAAIHQAEDKSYALGRPYPSSGMTDIALSRVLTNVDLAAEFVVDDILLEGRPPQWYDRKGLWTVQEDDEETWAVENLTATVCRYLNSGLPTILAENDEEHAQVVCGYLRANHIKGPSGSALNPQQSDVVALIVHDDQVGPYLEVPVSELAEKLSTARDLTLLIPLPHGLWLDGGQAERIGASLFSSEVKSRYGKLDPWLDALDDLEDGDKVLVREGMERAYSGVSVDTSVPNSEAILAVRSYALSGSDFKRGFAEVKPDCREIAGLVRLPKYVWVVEVHDRDLRGQQGSPAAIGTVVLDASAVVKRPSEWRSVEALLINVPGQIRVSGENTWRHVSPKPRYSCRWHHDRAWLISTDAVSARAKGAMSAR